MTKSHLLVIGAILAGVLPASPSSQPAASLSGIVTSEAEGRMEGVLVTAKLEGGNTTVTVITNEQGSYTFPAGRLRPGKYNLAIRAAGYELPAAPTAAIGFAKTSHVDIKLAKTKDLPSQLMGAEWMASVPGNEKQKRALFHCDQCHSLDVVATSSYDTDGWMSALPRMQNYW